MKLKVLISAYACEPGKGSEPEVGWRWALQMARFHDVTVLTRANNREAIEAADLPARFPEGGSLCFVYHDLSRRMLWLKKRLPLSTSWYYAAWQKSARALVRELAASGRFDLLHHVTYAAVRYPTALGDGLGLGIPTLWGPVGGVETAPWGLLSPRYPGPFLAEAARNLLTRLQGSRWAAPGREAARHTAVIASTRESQAFFQKLGVAAYLLPAIGISASECPPPPEPKAPAVHGPLRLLYVGRLLFWKGIELALRSLAQSGTAATLAFLGEGPFEKSARALAHRLGLGPRVEFRGKQPREAVMVAYREFDALFHPSLHDSGAFVVLEAMAQQLPVICLDRGGPALAVETGCGWKIGPGSRAQTINELAQAIRAADSDREKLRAMGETARESVLRRYGWDAQGKAMNAIYQQTLQAWEKRHG